MEVPSKLMKTLQGLGVSENECKAYLAILRLGVSTAVEVSRETHLQRTEIYSLVSGLVSKGLVEETIDRPRRFRPVGVKHALPRLVLRTRNQLDTITKESEELVVKLEGLAGKRSETPREEVRILYGMQSARAHLMESIGSAKVGFWAMAGRRRPPHISDPFLAEALALIASKGIKAKIIMEVDKENLKRVRKMTAGAEIAHYQPIPAYAYGVDDKIVAVSLVKEPVARASQLVQLISSYRPIVQVMRQFFDVLWRESTPFALRESLLLGQRLPTGMTHAIRGREETYIHVEAVADSAKKSIRMYIPTRYGPTRLLQQLGNALMRACRRGVKIRLICKLVDHNATAVKALARFAEVRHTDNPIEFALGIADDSDAGIYYTYPDSSESSNRADYTIRITSKDGVRHLGNMFEALWTESIPIEEQLEKNGRLRGESTKMPS